MLSSTGTLFSISETFQYRCNRTSQDSVREQNQAKIRLMDVDTEVEIHLLDSCRIRDFGSAPITPKTNEKTILGENKPIIKEYISLLATRQMQQWYYLPIFVKQSRLQTKGFKFSNFPLAESYSRLFLSYILPPLT